MSVVRRVPSARKKIGFCEVCKTEINKGVSYKWIAIRSYGTNRETRRIRCADCEDWHIWDTNTGLSAQCTKIVYETSRRLLNRAAYDSPAEAEAIMRDVSEEIRYFSNTRRISADRARYALGINNRKTVILSKEADELFAWAMKVRNWRCPKQLGEENTEEWRMAVSSSALEILEQCPI